MIIIGGVLLFSIRRVYNGSQNEKITNPAKGLEHMKKVEGEDAKATEAPTTTTIDAEPPEEEEQQMQH